jgi:hypothetical protein
MVVGGYDPDDLDRALEALLDKDEIPEYLTDDEWQSYRNGDETLVDLLEGSEIKRILSKKVSEMEPED